MRTKSIVFIIFAFLLCYSLFAAVCVAGNVYGSASGLNNQRPIVRDSIGNLYIAYPANDGAHYQIYIAFSSDGGATWDPTWATITSNSLDDILPSIAIDSYDTLHIVWKGNFAVNDADLMYRKYPGGTNTAICTYSGYPGANCPSIAVGSDDDLHVVYSGCPSSWMIRYLHYDRATSTWDAAEDVGTHTPSRWPSVEVDSGDDVHVIYRNQPGGNYRAAHREKTAGSWLPAEQIDIEVNSVEYTSVYIDNWDNIHALWVYRNGFSGNPDTIRYRRFNNTTTTWEPIFSVFGMDTALTYDGDVVVDTAGNIYVFYHDFSDIHLAVSYDGGISFATDSIVSGFPGGCRYPNARGSNFPSFNRIEDGCIDFVYVYRHPDSSVSYLYYDNLCGFTPEDSTLVCAHFIEPAESSFTSCADQQITLRIGCCSGGTMIIHSDSLSVEYFDSTMSDWRPVYEVSHGQGHSPSDSLDTLLSHWIWSEPGPSFTSSHDDWFRVLISYPFSCSHFDSAVITIHCDNKAYIYVNNDSCFDPAYYDTWVDTTNGGSLATYWWRLYCFDDILDYLHGGVDTIYIRGHNSSSIAGLQFQILVICSECCGEIDSSSIEFTINGTPYYTSDAMLSWDDESLLTFTPIAPDTFEDGDTITACITVANDTCGGILDSIVCRAFFIDLSAPVVYNIFPPIDTILTDSIPTVEFCLFDSISGLDTASITLQINDSTHYPTVSWTGDCWDILWTSLLSFHRGDTVNVCITATDSTDYCDDNVLDTCWAFYVRPCTEALSWIICPGDSFGFWTACTTQTVNFGIWDSTGTTIDTNRIYFTAIAKHITGIVDTITPTASFLFYGDTVLATTWSIWESGDTVNITLDSLFTTDGCITIP